MDALVSLKIIEAAKCGKEDFLDGGIQKYSQG